MLNAFLPGTPGAVGFAPTDSPEPLDRAVWIDVADPLAWEKPMVEERFGLSLPTRAGMTEIEASSRTFRSRGAVFLTIPLVVGLASDDPRTVPVTFILMRERLITMRYGDPQPFRILTSAYEHQPPPADPMLVLLRLLELVVDRAADTLEHMGSEIDAIARRIFGAPADRRLSTGDLNLILRRIGLTQFVLTKEHDSLVALARAIAFLGVPVPEAEGETAARPDRAHRDALKVLQRDIASLNENSAFLFSNVAFLLDAAMGRISVEQSAIIKIFSVAAVVLLPPTMVASIYGMNFEHMPELSWTWGYPLALLLMVLSAVLPYVWFKRKGWL